MLIFYKTGRFFVSLLRSLTLFFAFIGHVGSTITHIFFGNLHISQKTLLNILFSSGPVLVLPLAFISSLIGTSIALSTYNILSRFNLQENALVTTQDLLTHNLLPLMLGFILCGQFSLDLINARLKIANQQRSPEEVILDYILPIFIGITISALLLYIYLSTVFILSLYFIFHYFLNVTSGDFWSQIARSTTVLEIIASVLKTLFYCMIVSLTTGYYYYQIAINHVNLRKAVSRIITRGAFWLTIGSVCLRYFI